VLTIFFAFCFIDLVSYIWTKYSDFSQIGFYKIFQICQGIGYNKSMGILDNLENSWDDEFFFESAIYKPEMESLAAKLFSEICCDGCSCKSESDHQAD
jgi:hypothetical protein